MAASEFTAPPGPCPRCGSWNIEFDHEAGRKVTAKCRSCHQEWDPVLPKQVIRDEAAKSICQRAQELTTTQRNKDYGDPLINFKRIASLWSEFLGTPITPEQVTVCMALLKISRLAHQPGHLDSFTDIAGYMNCAGFLAGQGAASS